MTLIKTLEYFPELNALYQSDTKEFSSLFNRATEYVINKIALYPIVVNMSIKNTHSLTGNLLETSIGDIKFKEIRDIIAESYLESYPTYELGQETSLIVNGFYPDKLSGAVYYANNIIATTDAIVNVIGYIYPYTMCGTKESGAYSKYYYDFAEIDPDEYMLSNSLTYPLFAYMLSLFHLGKYNIAQANSYESMTIKYINILNANTSYATTSLGSTILEVTPYALN